MAVVKVVEFFFHSGPKPFLLALSFSTNYPAIQGPGVANFSRFLNMRFTPEISLKRQLV
jgi:hypothetical protein